MVEKKEVYRWIKIGGMLSFLPVILVTGPLCGYFVGIFLERKFGLSWYVSYIVIAIGAIASTVEAVRIIKLVYKIG